MESIQKQETCAQRVEGAKESRLNDIRVMLAPRLVDFSVIDDGTLDTVVTCPALGDEVARFSTEEAAEYRDEDTGALDETWFLEDHLDELRDVLRDRWAEYGLSWDWVDGADGESGFHCYLISTGGPGEELRFFSDASGHVYRIEFWFRDWFDGAGLNVTRDERAQMLLADFRECGMFDRVES